MINTKDKIVTILLGLAAIGIIVWALGPIVHAFYSICKDVENRESKKNYRYVYPIPETCLYLQTYFYNDSLCTFVGSDTAINNCSHFSVWYKSDLTLVLLDVVNDSLVYLVDHNNEVDNICNKSVIIEQVPKGFYNHDFYDQKYTEESILYYVPKFQQIARISIYSGKVRANDSVVLPMIIKHEACEFLKNNPQPTKEQVLQERDIIENRVWPGAAKGATVN